MSAKPRPRRPSRFESAAPSSSRVESRTVAKRQCSDTVSAPSGKTPKCVCVFPTSTTSSIGAITPARGRCGVPPVRRRRPASASVRARPSGNVSSGRSSSSGTSTNRRELTSACGRRQALGGVLEVAQQQQVDVDHPRSVAQPAGRPADLALDRLAGVEQRLGIELGLDLHAGVEEVRLVEHQADRLGLVDRRASDARSRRGAAARPPRPRRLARDHRRSSPARESRASLFTRRPPATPRPRPRSPAAPAAARAWPP